jgi:hypothetical protein
MAVVIFFSLVMSMASSGRRDILVLAALRER